MNLSPSEIDGIVWSVACALGGWLFIKVGPDLGSEERVNFGGFLFILWALFCLLMATGTI
jgi:hypothetical protein